MREIARLIEIGINHEQQHQELLLTDILALFAANPLRPAYRARRPHPVEPEPAAPGWIDFPGGIRSVGHDGEGFAWDNEAPRHEVLVHPFRLADRLVTNGEWLEFMADGGYATARALARRRLGHRQPRGLGGAALLGAARRGMARHVAGGPATPVERAAPVCHVSYYEADAFARWAGKRLPTEFEWEVAAQDVDGGGDDASAAGALRPLPAGPPTGGLRQMYGHVWQWTQSAYLPYPGYRPPAGALGEYNGKFMVSQQVLRGGSCATPAGHTRATYRNFFYPHQRWQFVGLRLAAEIE